MHKKFLRTSIVLSLAIICMNVPVPCQAMFKTLSETLEIEHNSKPLPPSCVITPRPGGGGNPLHTTGGKTHNQGDCPECKRYAAELVAKGQRESTIRNQMDTLVKKEEVEADLRAELLRAQIAALKMSNPSGNTDPKGTNK